MIRGRWRYARAVVSAACVLLLARTALAQPAGSAARLATLLQFFGGGAPLTAAEQADVADMNRQWFAANPGQAAQDDALNGKIIATLNKRDPRMTAKLWAIARLNYATPYVTPDPAARMLHAREAAIVAAHDPVFVADAAHKGVISRHVVDLMLQVNAAAAPVLGVPGPGGMTAEALGARLKAAFPGLTPDTQASLANAELNMPNGLPWLRGLPAPQRAKFIGQFKPIILAASDPVDQQMRLAEAMAAADLLGAKTYDAGVQKLMLRSFFLSRLRMQGLAQGTLNATARGY